MPTTVNVIHGDKTIVTAIYSISTEALNSISLHLMQSFTYIISPPPFPNVRSFVKTVYPGTRYAVFGDDSVSHVSDKHSKSKFEFVSSCSSCSVFEATLLMFKLPQSNPLGFERESHKSFS